MVGSTEGGHGYVWWGPSISFGKVYSLFLFIALVKYQMEQAYVSVVMSKGFV